METVYQGKIYEFISRLKAADIQVRLAGDQLKVSAARGRLSSEVLEQIRERKDDIINILTEQAHRDYAEISLTEDQEFYNVSYAQRSLWVIHQFEESRSAYNIIEISVFDGTVDRCALEKAVRQLVMRHEILRTTFFTLHGETKQRVHSADAMMPGIFFIDAVAEDPKRTVSDHLNAEANYVFDLEKGPLVRVSVIRCSEAECVFCLNIHHIISDGWSMKLLLKQLRYLYDQYVSRRQPVLPSQDMQYRHYTAWQRRILEQHDIRRCRDYWMNQMKGELPVLEFATDFARPPVRGYSGGSVEIWLGQEIRRSIVHFALQTETGVFMVLVAALNAMLYRYTGQSDIMIGTPVSGREHADLEQQLGCYVNTIVFRSRFSGDDTFRELLQQVKQVVIDGFDHQQYPFDRLVEDLHMTGDRSRNPLFDVLIMYEKEDAEGMAEATAALPFSPVMEGKVSAFDLIYDFQEKGDGIRLAVIYNTDLFVKERIGHMADHFRRWIQAAITCPDRPLWELDYISDTEENILLSGLNGRVSTSPDHTLKHLLEEQFRRTPDAIAMCCGEKRVTYAELNGRANKLAWLLKEKGIKAEMLVPVCFDRSPELVIAIAGIVKAGGAFVPINPACPEEQIRYILEDCGASFALCDNRGLEALMCAEGVECCCLSFEDDRLKKMPDVDIEETPGAGNAAYVIYSSGPEEQFKGVLIEHTAIVNHLCWGQEYFQLDGNDCVLHKAGTGSDVAVWELFYAVCTGATLVIAEPGKQNDSHYLRSVIDRHSVTTLFFVPSALDLFLWDIESKDSRSLRRVLCSGGVLKPEGIRRFKETFPAVDLYNLYGPGATAINVSCYHIPSARTAGGMLPVGKPVANTGLVVLDDHHKLVPQGMPGRLFIGGAQLPRGYLNNPELTAARFIRHPFCRHERLYDTGDIARWNWEGDILWQGRSDDQVWVHGYKVNLEEISAALLEYKHLKAAVVVKARIGEEDGLAGYVVWEDKPDEPGLKRFLRDHLPVYKHPVMYVSLKELPLTESGTVDRRQLPLLHTGGSGSYEPAGNEAEARMVKIWEEVFQRERIGVLDDFFELGGHSLKGMRLVFLIFKTFNIQTDLKTIFLFPTIRALCGELGKDALWKNDPAKMTGRAFSVTVDGEIYYEVTGGQVYWANAHHDSEYKKHDRRHGLMSLILEVKGTLDPVVFDKAVKLLYNRHESLRATFHFRNGACLMKVEEANKFCHFPEYLDSSDDHCHDQETADRFIYFRDHEFDFENGPLFLVRLMRKRNGNYIIAIRIHHVISDTWSIEIIARDLFTAYKAFKKGEQPALPELRYHFKEYLSLVIRAERDHWQAHREYWRKQFPTLPEELIIPAGRKRGRKEFQQKIVKVIRFPIPGNIYEGLKLLAKRLSTSIFVVLQATFKSYLHSRTGQHDIVIGTDVHGRQIPGLEDQIGGYAKTVLIRTAFDNSDTFEELVIKVKKANRDMLEYNGFSLLAWLLEILPAGMDIRGSIWKVNLQYSDATGYHVDSRLFNEIEEDLEISLLPDPANSVMLTPFDMQLNFVGSAEKLSLSVDYDSSLYSKHSMQHFINDFIAYMGQPDGVFRKK